MFFCVPTSQAFPLTQALVALYSLPTRKPPHDPPWPTFKCEDVRVDGDARCTRSQFLAVQSQAAEAISPHRHRQTKQNLVAADAEQGACARFSRRFRF